MQIKCIDKNCQDIVTASTSYKCINCPLDHWNALDKRMKIVEASASWVPNPMFMTEDYKIPK